MPMQYAHHNTPDEVYGYLRAALTLVIELDPPDELRERCFDHAVSLLSSKMAYGQPDAIPIASRLIGGNGLAG